jgi:hypothetical protein
MLRNKSGHSNAILPAIRRNIGDTDPVRGFLPAAELYRRAQSAFSSRHIPESLRLLQAAETMGHSANECAASRWNCWMLLGRFEEAWRESDAIAARGGCGSQCLWDGQAFKGKRVIIRCLHGFGDAIQFVRYARLIRSEAAGVAVQTHPQLISLFQRIPFLDRVTEWSDGPGERFRDWDQQIEVMELAWAFRTTPGTIPREVPYLCVEDRHRDGSRSALGAKARPRVGLLWEGGVWNPARNVPLTLLRPILEMQGFQFYSFQRGRGRDELSSHTLRERICDLSGDSADVVHFAADLLNMDLLITVDTMAAHLAGALGKPVWVLLQYEADWRWMLDRRDSPWYPTMRLFRQQDDRDWRTPLRQIALELETFAPRVAASSAGSVTVS